MQQGNVRQNMRSKFGRVIGNGFEAEVQDGLMMEMKKTRLWLNSYMNLVMWERKGMECLFILDLFLKREMFRLDY